MVVMCPATSPWVRARAWKRAIAASAQVNSRVWARIIAVMARA